ncbi:MAG: FtsK/SpoIIIE domain-containing protein [Caldilineaceae bacterium]
MDKKTIIDRPPRIQPELPFAQIEIPNPPAPEENNWMQLIQMAMPMLMILSMVFVTFSATGGRGYWLILPMLLSVVGMSGFAFLSYRRDRQKREETRKAYRARLVDLNNDLHNSHDQQRRFYIHNYPDPQVTQRIVRETQGEAEGRGKAPAVAQHNDGASLRSKARVWERRVDDEDFGAVRLGMGALPSTVIYTLNQQENEEDDLTREALKLNDDSRVVDNIPVIISLRPPREKQGVVEDEGSATAQDETQRTPFTHALGIAGDQASAYQFAHALLAHFAVFHQPADAQLYILAAKSNEWAWTEDLPHCQGDALGQRRCFLDKLTEATPKAGAKKNESNPLDQFLEDLRRTLANRKIRLQDREGKEATDDPTQPFLLVVVDLLDRSLLAGKTAAAQPNPALDKFKDLEADAAISILLAEGARLGAAVIFLTPDRSKVPDRCTAVIEVQETAPATNSKVTTQLERIHFRYTEVGVNSFRYVGVADYLRQADATVLAQRLGRMEVRQGFGANVPGSVPFLNLMGYRSLEDLVKDADDQWQRSLTAQEAGWLRVKIGLMSGNKPRQLIFAAKHDGVHGMVAGSTGSGKSELLISLIMGLAVNYAPSVLNFVLIDYKGGGAFKELYDLPHVVDLVTNIQRDGVTRMFTAINAEMQRRQALNAATGTKDIVEYREKNYHVTNEPYPFLFIIIDEFAEMIADRPEYKAQLESITRVGRAQGVSLLLAAQRPSGVTDQMRSNIKYRICLRVETPGESREMLRREDAAYLPGNIPGRGYMQVGNDEIELIQVAYTGDKYIDPNRPVAPPPAPVLWPKRTPVAEQVVDEEPPALYKAIVDRLKDLAKAQGFDQMRAPWPDPLPLDLALTTPLFVAPGTEQKALTSPRYLRLEDQKLITYGQPVAEDELTLNPALNRWLTGENGWLAQPDWESYALRAVVGLVDDPLASRQHPLLIDLPLGHLALFGSSGWGKTTFVRSLIISLAAGHSPDHFHAYVLDLGGRNLKALENLPHVGAVIIPDDEGYQERVEQLLRQLEEIVEERKTILAGVDLPDLYKYNQVYPSQALPAIVVAIDNFVEFKETFSGRDDEVETPMTKLVELARQAKSYGIHFVVTVGRLAELPYQLFSLFTERLSLKIADPGDYRTIVGSSVEDFTGLPGRGYVKGAQQQSLAFQIARPFAVAKSDDPLAESQPMAQLIANMAHWLTTASQRYRMPIAIKALPKAALLKDLLRQANKLEPTDDLLAQLPIITGQRWRDSLQADQADWLSVLLGVKSGNRRWDLHLEAKADGVHGLIAGGTGSGKSELLMTLLVSLGLAYDPTVLNFVLVDYKGGGAFQPFLDMPHVVDIVTNLNKSAVRRMFTAINAEMQRRQKLNADTNTKDIVDYRRQGLHLRKEPYPHLFIIIDEYAEMISDSPEFKAELESIARVGRAQGVNLLLAAQRPTGVTDQMRANIKYRICLRVEEVDTSREMLRRADAAYLPNGMPGRGYLQVGNEGVELIQVAYTGESIPEAEPLEGGRPAKFYDVAVRLTQQLLQSRQKPDSPWPRALAAKLTLSTLLAAKYQKPDYEGVRTMGQAGLPLVLNPFVRRWLAGQPAWHGVDWAQNAMQAIVGLVDDPYRACQWPLVLDFTKGHAVLFGASGWGKSTFLRTLVTSLAATHSPDEFQVHLLDLGGRNLSALESLPHVGSMISPDEKGYEERIQQVLRELNTLVDERKKLFNAAGVSTLYEYNQRAGVVVKPAILILIDNFAEFIETFGGHEEDETNPFEVMIALMRQAKPFGLHFMVTANRLNELSNKLLSLFTERLTLRLADSDDYRAIVGAVGGGGALEIDEIPGRGYLRMGSKPLQFQVALAVGEFDATGELRTFAGEPATELEQIRALGQQMQSVGKGAWSGNKPFRIGALPTSLFHRELLKRDLHFSQNDSFLGQLEVATRERWATHARADKADWLKVTLGEKSGEQLRTLHFAASVDGVHGLIAGGTGSGKSELLMTMIVGLALNYSPDILNFVLVDYKGGGAFKPFEGMPHCVDLITNLNKAAVNRMFVSIDAELRRRQALNANTGTKDIIDYRRKGYHETVEPYPHLFIIIDEYAEMISTNPEYRAALESITRVGRAQGVNLILAAQRPTGVSDQMRANIKLRICLRVEEGDTSHEMLRRRDAAYLPSIPGRGYIQVGNEHLEMIQVAWAGDRQQEERPAAVLWPQRPSASRGVVVVDQSIDAPQFFETAVVLMRSLYHERMAAKPWPNFLPNHFSLQSPLVDAQHDRLFTLTTAVSHWLNGDTADLWPGVTWEAEGAHPALQPVVGLIDNPAEARQEPLTFALHRSHLAVHGDSGMGKTAFLRTLLVSLATTHSPDELHVYILDLGGRNFRSVEEFPHVGDVIYADEPVFEERLQRLLELLETKVDERQQLLGEAGASTFFKYNARNPAAALPAILVLIDNFAELTESHDMLVEGVIMPLVRRSLAMGVIFVVTSNIPNNMPSKLYNLFSERITFKQSNFDRYMDIVGRGAVEIDDIPGRGYRRVGGWPLLLQTALPVGFFGERRGATGATQEADDLRTLARHMQQQIQHGKFTPRHYPAGVFVLKELVTLRELLDEAGPAAGRTKRIEAVLGRDSTLQPALFDLKRFGPHFAVVGPPLSGKTTALYNWIFSLTYRYNPSQVRLVLVDLQGRFVNYGGKQQLRDLPHVLTTVYEIEEVVGLVERLKRECAALATSESGSELFVVIDDFDDFSELLEDQRSLGRELANLARQFGRVGLHFVVAGALEGNHTEFRRQVQSSNYGIGLRVAQSVDTLRVLRRPPALQDRELTVGRGFVVRSGQATLIQVAAPYAMHTEEPLTDLDDDAAAEQKSQALDSWVKLIKVKHSGQQALWANGERAAPLTVTTTPTVNGNLRKALDLLRQLSAQSHDNGNGNSNGAGDDVSLLASYIRAEFERTGLSHVVLLASTPDEVLTAAAGYLSDQAVNGRNGAD